MSFETVPKANYGKRVCPNELNAIVKLRGVRWDIVIYPFSFRIPLQGLGQISRRAEERKSVSQKKKETGWENSQGENTYGMCYPTKLNHHNVP